MFLKLFLLYKIFYSAYGSKKFFLEEDILTAIIKSKLN